MATQADLDFTYSLTDRIFRLSLGELADFSGAKYDGDFSLSLAEAQRRKHAFVVESARIGPGSRVLDLGCGWGPMLAVVRDLGGEGVGVTLSSAQAAACRRHGLDARLMDAREVTRDTFGSFDAVVSLGAFEHFCSRDDYEAGRQDAIYSSLFENVAGLLPPAGRLYLQTMVFGRNMIPEDQIGLDRPPHSDGWYLALLQCQFPGSWLPYGAEQVERCAAPYFDVVSRTSGRLDYIETIREWRQRFGERSARKLALKARLVPRWLTSHEFRLAFTSGVSPNGVCFERELLDHFRIVLERR